MSRAVGGLRPAENPFRVRRIAPGALQYRFADPRGSTEDLTRHVIESRDVDTKPFLIVGPHGSGKTTLLKQLASELSSTLGEAAWVGLSSSDSRRRKLDQVESAISDQPSRLIIIDGLEQISVINRFRLTRWIRRAGLVCLASSHRRLRGWRTLHETKSTPELILGLCDELLAGCDPQVTAKIRSATASRDLSATTDVRSLWFDLYDIAAEA